MSDWREIAGNQNLRMAQQMLEQQGEIDRLTTERDEARAERDRVRRQFDEYKTRTDEAVDVLREELIDASPVLHAARRLWFACPDKSDIRLTEHVRDAIVAVTDAVARFETPVATPGESAPSAAEGLPVSSVEEADG